MDLFKRPLHFTRPRFRWTLSPFAIKYKLCLPEYFNINSDLFDSIFMSETSRNNDIIAFEVKFDVNTRVEFERLNELYAYGEIFDCGLIKTTNSGGKYTTWDLNNSYVSDVDILDYDIVDGQPIKWLFKIKTHDCIKTYDIPL